MFTIAQHPILGFVDICYYVNTTEEKGNGTTEIIGWQWLPWLPVVVIGYHSVELLEDVTCNDINLEYRLQRLLFIVCVVIAGNRLIP